MPMPKKLIPTIYLRVGLPEDLHTKVTLFLFSEMEGRVPLGKYQEFFSARIREFFDSRRLDLAPWTGQPPEAFVVSGAPATIALLRKTLDEDRIEQ